MRPLLLHRVALVSFRLYVSAKFGQLARIFWAKGLPPPLAKNFPYAYDDHDECDVDERDEALPTCPSDEIGESSDQPSSAVRIRVGLLMLSSKCMYIALQRTG